MNFSEDDAPIDFNPPAEERPDGGSFAGSADDLMDIVDNINP
jgi:hypothetical protein